MDPLTLPALLTFFVGKWWSFYRMSESMIRFVSSIILRIMQFWNLCIISHVCFFKNSKIVLPDGWKACKLTGRCHRKWFLCNVVTVVNLISNTFKLLQVYQGLTVGHLVAQKTTPAPCGMVYDPRTKCLVTNGKPGHLQFYNVETDKQLYNVSYYFFRSIWEKIFVWF